MKSFSIVNIVDTTIISAGAIEAPTWSINKATRELTVGSAMYNMYSDIDYDGIFHEFTIPGGTFIIPDDDVPYAVIADYNGGTPVLRLGLRTEVNDSNLLGIFTVSWVMGDLSIIAWGDEASSTVDKLKRTTLGSFRFTREGQRGLDLAVSAEGYILVSSATVYAGIALKYMPEVNTGDVDNQCYQMVSDGLGGYTGTHETVLPTTLYDDGNGNLLTMTDGKYYSIHVYRSMSDDSKRVAYFIGQQYDTLDEAKLAPAPGVPDVFTTDGLLIGHITGLKGSLPAAEDVINLLNVSGTGAQQVIAHNNLLDKEGGGTNGYYHSNYVIDRVGKIEFDIRTTDFDGFMLCDGRTMTTEQWGKVTNAGLDTAWTAAYGSMLLPDARGRALGIAGQGATLTNRTLGDKVGTETHTLTVDEMPAHHHTIVGDAVFNPSGGTVAYTGGDTLNTTLTDNSIQDTGGGLPHNNMQPTAFVVNMFIYIG